MSNNAFRMKNKYDNKLITTLNVRKIKDFERQQQGHKVTKCYRFDK